MHPSTGVPGNAPVPDEQRSSSGAASLTILLVDPSREDRERIKEQLVGLPGLVFEEVSDARHLTELNPDVGLAVIDHHPPDWDGLELFRWLQAQRADLPVILVTGRGDESLAVAALKAGVSDYLPKKQLGRLAEAVRACLQGHGSRPTTPEREARMRLALEAAGAGIWEWDLNRDRVWYSEEVAALFLGLPRQEGVVAADAIRLRIHEEDRQRVRAVLEQAIQSRGTYHVEYRINLPDGEVRWVSSLGRVYEAGHGRPARILGVSREVTRRKQAEVLQRDQNRVLEMLARGRPLPEVLATVVELLQTQVPDTLGSILLLDEAGQRLHHGAAPHLPPSYTHPFIDGIEIGPEAGSCGTAAYLGAPVGVSDIATDPKWAAYRDLALAHGLRACWSTPVLSREGQVLGTLALYSKQPRTAEPGDWELLESASRLTALVIEHHQALACIQAQERRFRALVENAFDGITVLGPDGNVLYESPSGARLLGFTPGETLGLNFRERCHPDDAALADEHFARLAQTPSADGLNVQARMLHTDGSWRRIEASGRNLLHDPDVQGIVVNWRDITEPKNAEEGVRESELRLRQLTESIDAVLWLADADGRILYVSSAYERLWGRSAQQLLQDPEDWFQLIHPDDREHVARAWREQRDQPLDLQYRAATGDRWVRDRSFPVLDENGRVVRTAGITEDITESKRLRERIREQAALLDAAHDAILVCDLDDRIVYSNRGAERLFGWSADEALGRSARELMWRGSESLLDEIWEALLKAGEWRGEARLRKRSGGQHAVDVSNTLLRDEHGRPQARLSISTDVTEKKQLESRFLRAQRLESLGTLAGGIAHDLNNVLTPVLLAVGLLRANPSENQRQQVLDTIDLSVSRAADMLRQILRFARGEEGDRQVLDLGDVFASVLNLLEHTLPKSIRVEVNLAPDLGPVLGDVTQLSQVIMNLSVNARDAMPNGGVLTLSACNVELDARTARAYPEGQPGPYVLLSVSDSGTGVHPEVLDKIFDPFFTTKDQGKGTGLGLTTVQGIVRRHDGFLDVESQPGKGTLLRIWLPIVAKATAPAVAPKPPPARRTQSVLMVDDEPAIRHMASETLRKHGYQVLTAADGAEALDVYRQHRHEIDVVVIDLMMPVVDGLSAIRAIRAIDPEARIIAASGLTSSASLPEVPGHQTFLTKPYTTQDLLRVVAEVLPDTPS